MAEKHKIADDLLELKYPVKNLKLLPGNPNKGDPQAVAHLYDAVGQRKPIVARHDGKEELVIAGNTQLQAARDILGWTHIAVSWADDLDEAQSATFILGDNETARKSELDKEAAIRLAETFEDNPVLLEASSFDLDEVRRRYEEIGEEVDFELPEVEEDLEDEPPAPRTVGEPVIQYAIIFDDDEQKQHWYSFMRWLKKADPEGTIAGRIDSYLVNNLPDEVLE